MEAHSFALVPFTPAEQTAGVIIGGSIGRQGARLSLHYELRGDLSGLVIPVPEARPLRLKRLWETTCFELFMACRGEPRYLEFNLSPAGHWNVFRFEDYRQGMREEPAVSDLPFRVQSSPGLLHLALELGSETKTIPANLPLEAGLSAVVANRHGPIDYYALSHPGPEADFHRRDTFLIELPP